MDNKGTATAVEEEGSQAVLEVDPLRVMVAETYSDSNVDVVHAKLGDDLRVTIPNGGAAGVRMASDDVVIVAAEDVVLVALSVPREREQISSVATRSAVVSLEMIGQAQEALDAAARALRWQWSQHD